MEILLIKDFWELLVPSPPSHPSLWKISYTGCGESDATRDLLEILMWQINHNSFFTVKNDNNNLFSFKKIQAHLSPLPGSIIIFNVVSLVKKLNELQEAGEMEEYCN